MATEAQTHALAPEASAEERLLTAEQAAVLAGLHPETIRERGRRGLLQTVTYGKRRAIPEERPAARHNGDDVFEGCATLETLWGLSSAARSGQSTIRDMLGVRRLKVVGSKTEAKDLLEQKRSERRAAKQAAASEAG